MNLINMHWAGTTIDPGITPGTVVPFDFNQTTKTVYHSLLDDKACRVSEGEARTWQYVYVGVHAYTSPLENDFAIHTFVAMPPVKTALRWRGDSEGCGSDQSVRPVEGDCPVEGVCQKGES